MASSCSSRRSRQSTSRRSGTSVTTSPPDTTLSEEAPEPEAPEPTELETFGRSVAEAVGGTVAEAIGVAKIEVDPSGWVEAARTARDDFGLIYFSFLSAIDWSNDPAVGDPLAEDVEERYEVLCTLTELVGGKRVTLSTDVPKAVSYTHLTLP